VQCSAVQCSAVQTPVRRQLGSLHLLQELLVLVPTGERVGRGHLDTGRESLYFLLSQSTLHTAASSQGKVQLNLSQNIAFTFFKHIGTGLWLDPLSMTPQFAGISVPGVHFSQPEPQNISFFYRL
jgi:hypothetical protein